MNVKKANPIDIQVGSRIRIRRLMINMSQMQLASHLGITFQQVQKYEKGVNRVGASRLMAISDTLGVQPGFFFQNDDPLLSHTNAGQQDTEQSAAASVLTADGIALNKAFLKVTDPALRRHIVGLVKVIAEREKNDGPKTVEERANLHPADKNRSSPWQ